MHLLGLLTRIVGECQPHHREAPFLVHTSSSGNWNLRTFHEEMVIGPIPPKPCPGHHSCFASRGPWSCSAQSKPLQNSWLSARCLLPPLCSIFSVILQRLLCHFTLRKLRLTTLVTFGYLRFLKVGVP